MKLCLTGIPYGKYHPTKKLWMFLASLLYYAIHLFKRNGANTTFREAFFVSGQSLAGLQPQSTCNYYPRSTKRKVHCSITILQYTEVAKAPGLCCKVFKVSDRLPFGAKNYKSLLYTDFASVYQKQLYTSPWRYPCLSCGLSQPPSYQVKKRFFTIQVYASISPPL